MEALPIIDVFLSRKSQDAPLARPLYDFLVSRGLNVFDSDESLPKLGNADYRRAIDQALDSCVHMIVVGSSAENICSPWVEAEWGGFISEKRAGNKHGNILTVISTAVNRKSLPFSLRAYYEVIPLERNNFERIYAYVKAKENGNTKNQMTEGSLMYKKSLLQTQPLPKLRTNTGHITNDHLMSSPEGYARRVTTIEETWTRVPSWPKLISIPFTQNNSPRPGILMSTEEIRKLLDQAKNEPRKKIQPSRDQPTQ